MILVVWLVWPSSIYFVELIISLIGERNVVRTQAGIKCDSAGNGYFSHVKCTQCRNRIVVKNFKMSQNTFRARRRFYHTNGHG